MADKKAIINPQNQDQEYFKWALIAASKWEEIIKNPQLLSNLRKYKSEFDWSGLEFPVAVKGIKSFENPNKIFINLLAIEGKEIYICKKERNMISK